MYLRPPPTVTNTQPVPTPHLPRLGQTGSVGPVSETETERENEKTVDVAVVGAGIAGCTAASFLRDALGDEATISVYERAPLVGGRLATLNVGGVDVEAGGTIIHETNRYMAGFVEALGLKRVEPHQGENGGGGSSVGLWDGKTLVFRTHDSALRTKFTALKRYGVIAPLRLQRAVSRSVKMWNSVYDRLEAGHGFDSPSSMLDDLGLSGMLDRDGRQWLRDRGVRGRFVDEYADGVGRIMYGQDVSMNAFATSIALAGAGLAGSLFSVGGGNRLVCEGLLRDAAAALRVESEVTGLAGNNRKPGITLEFADGTSSRHDAVVLATPTGPAELSLTSLDVPASALRPRAFQTTWATFVKGAARPEYFGVTDVRSMPDTVLTVEDESIPFSSLGLVSASPDGTAVYKLFSREQPREALLDQMFAERVATEQLRWAAYPVLRPDGALSPFRLRSNLYWANTMEFATSTMETEAVAARNVVNLLVAEMNANDQ